MSCYISRHLNQCLVIVGTLSVSSYIPLSGPNLCRRLKNDINRKLGIKEEKWLIFSLIIIELPCKVHYCLILGVSFAHL